MEQDKTESHDPCDKGPAEPQAAGNSADDDPDRIDVVGVVEAVLFSTDGPLAPSKLAAIVGTGTARDMRRHVAALNQRYQRDGAAFRIEEIAGGFQMYTLPQYAPWINKLHKVRADSKLSPAALETLAIVAYKQPVLRTDVEAIRGVSCAEVLRSLLEKGLIKVVGYAEELGRPRLYGTTRKFLEVFGLRDPSDLPKVSELKPPQ